MKPRSPRRIPLTTKYAAWVAAATPTGVDTSTFRAPTTRIHAKMAGATNWCNACKHRPSVLNQKFLSTLGVDGDRAVTKPFDGGQDVVGGFGPAKRLGVGIAGVDVGGDGGLQRGGRAVGAALDLLVG